MAMNWQAGALQLGLGAAVLSLALPGQACAQELESTGLTFGKPARSIDLSLSGEVTYDTNVARSSDAGAIARGIQKNDFRFSPALEGNIALPTPAAVLTLRGAVGYEFYARNSQLNRERLNLLAGASSRLSVCDVAAQVGYSRGQNDLADLSIVPGDVATSSVNVQETVRAGGNLTCGSGRIRPYAFAEYRTTDNSAPQRRISDVETTTYGAGASYSSPAFGILTAYVGRSEFDFKNRASLPGAIRAFDQTMWGLKLDRRLGARLQVNGQVYWTALKGLGNTGNSLDGLNWDISATLRAGERAQLTLGTARQIDASAAFNVNAARATSYLANLNYVLTPLLQASISASVRKRKFDVDPTLLPLAVLTDDRITQVGARLSYTLGRRIHLDLSATHQARKADTTLYNFNTTRIGLAARIKI